MLLKTAWFSLGLQKCCLLPDIPTSAANECVFCIVFYAVKLHQAWLRHIILR